MDVTWKNAKRNVKKLIRTSKRSIKKNFNCEKFHQVAEKI